MNSLHDLGYEPDDLSVTISELLVATADGHDHAIESAVPEVLRLLRDKMSMDVVFVSEFVDGKRVFRHVQTTPGGNVIAEGGSDPLEESWCQRVVDGRLPQYIENAATFPGTAEEVGKYPFPIGTHISAPIVLNDGQVYGTLCAFSFAPRDKPNTSDLKKLQFTAQLTAQKIEKQRADDRKSLALAELSLEPVKRRSKRK